MGRRVTWIGPRVFIWMATVTRSTWAPADSISHARKRVSLTSLNYTFLNVFPNDNCAGKPGHIETFASDNGIDVVEKDYSGFQETIATLVAPTNLIGTGYLHHSE